MSSAADFTGAYSPGGLSGRSRRRELARRAGLASGRKRRQLARGRRHGERQRTRGAALALRYRVRQLNRRQFAALYARHWPNGNAAGLETCWRLYVGLFRLYRKRGQHAGTTNKRQGLALEAMGRGRCRRTVQRTHRKLELMGVARVSWHRDQRDTPGHKDHLVVELRTPRLKNVTRPPNGGSGSPATPLAPAPQPEKTGIPPPPAAETEPAGKPPERQGTETEEICRAIRLCEQKLTAGWPAGRLKAKIGYLRARLRQLEAPDDP